MHRTIFTAAAFALCVMGQAFASDLTPVTNQQYLVTNAKKPGVMVLPSGLQYRVIKSGSGKMPTINDVVTVAYKGARIDGYIFDQTKPGETRNLPVRSLIPGWVEALSLMKEGDEWELVLPSALGYGATRTSDGQIPPDQTLVFDMQLIAIVH